MDGPESESLPLGGVPKATEGWKRKVNTAAFIFALFAGGFGFGFIYSQRQADASLAQARVDHLAEIARLQDAHARVVGSLASSAVKATENAAVATGQAAKAVESATTVRNKPNN